MSNDVIAVELQKREILGKQVKGMRRAGSVPAVIHDHGKPSIHVSGSTIDLEKVYHQAGKNHPVEVTVGGKKYTTLIKDVAIAPTKHNLQHIVFQAVNANETVEAEVPIHLVGEVPAERLSLMVLKSLEHVQVEAVPSKLPENFEVDGSALAEVGDRITVGDIKPVEGVTILTEPEQIIYVVEAPRVQEEPETVEGGEEAEIATEEGAEKAEPAKEE